MKQVVIMRRTPGGRSSNKYWRSGSSARALWAPIMTKANPLDRLFEY